MATVTFFYQDGSNYKFFPKFEIPDSLIDEKEIKEGQEDVDYTTLGITREQFHDAIGYKFDDSPDGDHCLVKIELIERVSFKVSEELVRLTSSIKRDIPFDQTDGDDVVATFYINSDPLRMPREFGKIRMSLKTEYRNESVGDVSTHIQPVLRLHYISDVHLNEPVYMCSYGAMNKEESKFLVDWFMSIRNLAREKQNHMLELTKQNIRAILGESIVPRN